MLLLEYANNFVISYIATSSIRLIDSRSYWPPEKTTTGAHRPYVWSGWRKYRDLLLSMNFAPFALRFCKLCPHFVALLLTINCCSYLASAQPHGLYLPSKLVQVMAKKDTNSWVYDLMAAHYSFIGQYKQALTVYDLADTVKGTAMTTDLANCTPVEARQYINRRSKKAKIIIINEAHHQPLHRVFTQSLLDSLWRNGYRYFGLEGLADGQAVTKRGTIKLTDGFYSAEPQFANMLRHALKLGFRLFSYEATGKTGTAREDEQASRIWGVMKAYPRDKFIVHCGFSHVTEANHPDWGKAMAGRLKQLSGYDPFTIDQVEMSERSQSYYEADAFKQLKVKKASVLVTATDSVCRISGEPHSIDVKIVHPRSSYVYDRPTWLVKDASYRYVDPSKYFKQRHFPCLVFAYKFDENDTHVPIDIIELTNAHDVKQLILPVGTYRLKRVYEQTVSQLYKVVIK